MTRHRYGVRLAGAPSSDWYSDPNTAERRAQELERQGRAVTRRYWTGSGFAHPTRFTS